jgi:hypothetical protein
MRERQPSDGRDRRLDATKERARVSFLSLSLLFVLTRSGLVALVFRVFVACSLWLFVLLLGFPLVGCEGARVSQGFVGPVYGS